MCGYLKDIRETVQQRRLALFGHVAGLPTVVTVPVSAALSIASTKANISKFYQP